MSVANLARVVAVLIACIAAAGSATSRSGSSDGAAGGPAGQNGPPPAQQMEPNLALGLWRSTFGAVKIEADNSQGGLSAGNLQGVWVYQRQGQEVIGYFSGNLRGNVLQFHWQEPNNPPLTGEGYLVFDPQGRQYEGRWWSEKRDRVGEWNGWRPTGGRDGQSRGASSAYGQDGNDGQGQDPYQGQQNQRQPYPRQPSRSPYQQGPYQQGGPPQQPPQQQPPQQPPPAYYN
jgi:hypothetical protein